MLITTKNDYVGFKGERFIRESINRNNEDKPANKQRKEDKKNGL